MIAAPEVDIELFPCSGGMAEGFRRAGVAFAFAFDKDVDACDSYERNHGHRPVQMDAVDLLRMVRGGWRPGPARLLVADPPCTPWSRAGKRLGVEDERDMLGTTTELILLLRPKCYLIGNVPGLDDSTQWHHLQAALAPLAKAGYCIRDYATLDAADFGVPQHRVRPFWFGHLAGPCIAWPMPTHCDPEELRAGTLALHPLKPWVTCRDALGHLAAEQLGTPRWLRYRGAQASTERQRKRAGKKARASEPSETIRAKADAVMARPWGRARGQNGVEIGSSLERPAKVVGVSTLSDGNWLNLSARHPPAQPAQPAQPARTLGAKDRRQSTVLLMDDGHPPSSPDAPARTLHGEGGRAGRPESCLLIREPDPNRPPAEPDEPHRAVTGVAAQALIEWPWNRPSTTTTTTPRIPAPGHHGGSMMSQPNAVVLSELAATILQGFPESWVFSGKTKRARWSQLGQAMPPALAEAVARSVVEQMRKTEGDIFARSVSRG